MINPKQILEDYHKLRLLAEKRATDLLTIAGEDDTTKYMLITRPYKEKSYWGGVLSVKFVNGGHPALSEFEDYVAYKTVPEITIELNIEHLEMTEEQWTTYINQLKDKKS